MRKKECLISPTYWTCWSSAGLATRSNCAFDDFMFHDLILNVVKNEYLAFYVQVVVKGNCLPDLFTRAASMP